MDYIKEKVKCIVMENIQTLKIHETMTEGIHYKFSTHGQYVVSHAPGSYKGIEGSSMFTITIRPVGGLMEYECEKITNFILNASWILYFAMGLEMVGKKRDSQHLTVHFVTRGMITGKVSAVDGMKSIFHGLLEDARIVSVKNKDGKLCGTIDIKSCSKNHMPTKTALTHCVYPLKDAVKDKRREDITDADFNNGKTHWTNLFDGEKECTDGEKEQWQMNRLTFAHLLVEEHKKKKHNAPHLIHPRTQNEQASKYAFDNGLEWTPESHEHILATMIVDKLGEKKFMLAPSFLKKAVQESLYRQDYRVDYKELTEQALRNHAKKGDKLLSNYGTTVSTCAKIKQIKSLEEQTRTLETEKQEWMAKANQLEEENKRQQSSIDKLQEGNIKLHTKQKTLNQTLEVLTSELAWCINQGLDVKTTYERNRVFKEMCFERQQFYRHSNKISKEKWESGVIEKWRREREEEWSKQQQSQAATRPTKRVKVSHPNKTSGVLVVPCDEKRARQEAALKKRGC